MKTLRGSSTKKRRAMPNGSPGRRLALLRASQGITGRALSRAAGCSLIMLYNYELGRPLPASMGNVLASLLGSSAGYLES